MRPLIPGADGWSHVIPFLFSPGAQEKELGVERIREQLGGSWGGQRKRKQ